MTRKWGGTRRRKYEEVENALERASLGRLPHYERVRSCPFSQPARRTDRRIQHGHQMRNALQTKLTKEKKRPRRCLKNYGRREGVSTAWLARFRCHRNYHIWTRLFSRSLRGSMSLLPNDSPFFVAATLSTWLFSQGGGGHKKGGTGKDVIFLALSPLPLPFPAIKTTILLLLPLRLPGYVWKSRKKENAGQGPSLSRSLSFFFLFFSIRSWLPHGGNVYIYLVLAGREGEEKKWNRFLLAAAAALWGIVVFVFLFLFPTLCYHKNMFTLWARERNNVGLLLQKHKWLCYPRGWTTATIHTNTLLYPSTIVI